MPLAYSLKMSASGRQAAAADQVDTKQCLAMFLSRDVELYARH
jgi:hypothetical protein